MQIQLKHGRVFDLSAEALAIPAFEGEAGGDAALNDATGGWAEEIARSGEFTGKAAEISMLHRPAGSKARRLVLIGAGKREKFGENEMRKLAGVATRKLKGLSIRNVSLFLPERYATPAFAQAAAEGAVLGDFEPDQLRTDPKKHDTRLDSFTVFVESASSALEKAAETGRIIAEAQNFSRELVNLPSNLLTPEVMAERAKSMAAEAGLECEVLDEGQMRELGMGALLGVSQGSENPGVLIVLRYSPSNLLSSDHLALIGKGVTFDTGGVSIKPHEGMEKMKYDMGGGAAVIGAMRAIAQLKPGVRVTGFVPAAENMVSGRAQRPGDVVTSMSGKTIEVLNTDAEGRLLLADAMTYALKQGCTHLVDAATLTGAIVVALGHVHIGAFGNDDEMIRKVIAAGRETGESMWHMPLDDDYSEYLKSAFADLPNIGGRWGGAVTAAKFLQAFVEKKPWVHLDIAGTAWLDDAKPYLAKGPTGVPIRTFVQLALGWESQR